MFDSNDVSMASLSGEESLMVTQNPNNCQLKILNADCGTKLNRALFSPSVQKDSHCSPRAIVTLEGAHKKISLSDKADKERQTPHKTAKTFGKYSPADTFTSSLKARRVIFPWLHTQPELPVVDEVAESVLLERKESGPADSPKAQPPLPSEILLLLTSPNPRLLQRTSSQENNYNNMCRSTQPRNQFGIQLESLQIPPFKGVVYPSESSTLAATCCLRPAKLPLLDFLRPPSAKTGQLKPLKSILRTKSVRTVDCKQLDVDFASPRSSLPRLVSLKDEEDDSQSSSGTISPECSKNLEECPDSDSNFSRSSTSRMISFDPRVWVREFQRTEDEKRSTWYSPKEMERFKTYTLMRILEYRGSKLFSTGTGRTVQVPAPVSKAVYTNPALTLESENDDLKDEATPFHCAVLECEIRNILIVDPHDICLKLLEKSFKRIIPHATVTTVRTSQEALNHYYGNAQPFDVVLVEERLHFFQRQDSTSPGGGPSSGSSLIRKLRSASRGDCLFIGISANLDKDETKLQDSGADLVWSKPPPAMNSNVRETILKTLLLKRGRRALAMALFGTALKS
jgi:hypothetical protein